MSEGSEENNESIDGSGKNFITQPKDQIVYTEPQETGFVVSHKDWGRVKRKIDGVKDRAGGIKVVLSVFYSIAGASLIEMVFGYLRGVDSSPYYMILVLLFIGGSVIGGIATYQDKRDKEIFNNTLDEVKKEMEEIEN